MESFDSAPFSSNSSTNSNLTQSNIVPFVAPKSALRRRRQDVGMARPSFWQNFWDVLYRILIPSSTLRVQQKRSADGNEYYNVYDPLTGTSKTFGSELETRIWLDRRFYE